MSTPNRKDLRKIRALRSQIKKIQSCYSGLSEETKQFVLEKFGETDIHLMHVDYNLREIEREILNPKSNESKMQ